MKERSSPRRSRSNDGYRMQSQSLLPLRPELIAALSDGATAVSPRREARVFHGPKAIRASAKPGGTAPQRFDDAEVLEIRRMLEWLRFRVGLIARITGSTAEQLHPITEWRNRVHLDPGQRPTIIDPAVHFPKWGAAIGLAGDAS